MSAQKPDSETFEIDKPTETDEREEHLSGKQEVIDKVSGVFDITQPKDIETKKKTEKSDSEEEKGNKSDSSKKDEEKDKENENSPKSPNNEHENKDSDEGKEEEKHAEEEEPDLFDELLKGTKTPKDVPPSEYRSIISQCTYYIKDCQEVYDVEGVARGKQIENDINELYKQQTQKEAYDQYTGKIRERLDRANQNVDRIEERYQQLRAKLDEKHSRELSDLHEKQREEMSNFENGWESSQKARRYTRASTELSELRHIRRCVAATGDVERTRDIEVLERRCEEKDIQEKSKAMYLTFENDRQILRAKHKRNENVMLDTQEKELNALELAYKSDMQAAKLRVQNIENAMKSAQNTDVVWKTHFRGEKSSIPRPATSASKTRSVNNKASLWRLSLPPLSQTRPSSSNSMRPPSRKSQSRVSTPMLPYKREYSTFR